MSGSWKTTLQNYMLSKWYVTLYNFVTRQPRNDKELDEYIFLTTKQVREKKARGDFVEEISYQGRFYGMSEYTTEGELLKNSSKDVVAIVTPEWRRQFIDYCVVNDVPFRTIFLDIDQEKQKERLNIRGEKENRTNDFQIIKPTMFCEIVNGDLTTEQIYLLITNANE